MISVVSTSSGHGSNLVIPKRVSIASFQSYGHSPSIEHKVHWSYSLSMILKQPFFMYGKVLTIFSIRIAPNTTESS